MRSHAWKAAEGQKLTPTQADILTFLKAKGAPQRLADVADALGVSRPTACDAVATLVGKGLVAKEKDTEDRRAIALRLTVDGVWEADRIAEWPGFLLGAVGTLTAEEQEKLYGSLFVMIDALQGADKLAPSGHCRSCRHFQPHRYSNEGAPHHCGHFASPLGDRHLRLDCAEHRARGEG